MRVLHVVQLKPPTTTWFGSSLPASVTGLAGVLMLRSLTDGALEHEHHIALIGVEDDAAWLAREGVLPARLVSPPLLQPRAAASAIAKDAQRIKPGVVIGWGAAAAACVEALPAWLTRVAIDLRTSHARRIDARESDAALPASDVAHTPQPAKAAARRELALPDDGLCVLGLHDVATPLDLHHTLYALGSATVAGHRVVLCLAPDAALDPDLLSLVRAQHYVRDIRVIDASFRTLASACDAAVTCAPPDAPVGVAATRTLVHACVRTQTPVFMLSNMSAHLALPPELFSPGAHRGNHTDIAGFLTRAGDLRPWLNELVHAQAASLTQPSGVTLQAALFSRITTPHAARA